MINAGSEGGRLRYRPFYRARRAALFTLVDTLALAASTADHAMLDAVEFIRTIRHRRGDWIPEQATTVRDGRQVTVSVEVDAFAGDVWRTALHDKKHQGMLARRHLEVCVYTAGVISHATTAISTSLNAVNGGVICTDSSGGRGAAGGTSLVEGTC